MSCGFCGEALSGLTNGLVALVSFIVFPMIQIILALCRILLERLGRVYRLK